MTTEALAMAAGVLLLTAVMQLWRRSVSGAITLLVVQGAALAGLAATLAAVDQDSELYVVAALVLLVKAGLLPAVLSRTATGTGTSREDTPRVAPTTGLLLAAALTTVAYLAAQPVAGARPAATAQTVPVGIALVLIGFLILLTRRQAVSQLVGFIVLDNGIAAVALLAAGGVPLVVELGVMLDVVLVVLVLRVLAGRMMRAFGGSDLTDLTELRD
jgi:hydrogenase-4 component E